MDTNMWNRKNSKIFFTHVLENINLPNPTFGIILSFRNTFPWIYLLRQLTFPALIVFATKTTTIHRQVIQFSVESTLTADLVISNSQIRSLSTS